MGKRLRNKALPTAVFLLWAGLLVLGGRLWAAQSPLRAPGDFSRCQDGRPFAQEYYNYAGGSPALLGQPPKELLATLVLVHGYHSESSVWTGLVQQLHLAGPVRVLRVCYPTVDRSSLRGGADALARLVNQEYPPAPGVPVYFIGHSFGGLVIKQMLADDAALPQPRFQNWPGGVTVVTIDTPHHGTEASYFRFMTGESILALMAEEAHMRLVLRFWTNPALEALHDARFLAHLPVHTIAGQFNASPFNAYLGGALVGRSDGVVSSRGAHLDVLHRDWRPSALNYLGGHPVACIRGSQPTWRRYLFTSPIYQQDVFHTRINMSNPAVAQIVSAIVRGGNEAQLLREGREAGGLQCDDYAPGSEGFGRWALTVGAILAPLLLVARMLWYLGLPPARRQQVAAGSALLAWARRPVPPAVWRYFGLAPDRQLDLRFAVPWALAAALTAFLPSFGLTLGYYLSNWQLSPVLLVLVIALAEQGMALLVFHQFLRHELGAKGSDPHLEQVCRAYGFIFGAVLGVFEQIIFATAVGGATAWARILFGLPARMFLGWAMGWLYGRLVVAVEKTLVREALLALLPLVCLHTAYAALFVHVMGTLDALLILGAGLGGPLVIMWLANTRGRPEDWLPEA